MTLRIVGLHGPIGSGKSTLARMLANRLTHQGLDVGRYSFAEPIKTLMNALFGWDDRHSFGDLKEVIDPEWGVSPRYVYRMFGTEFGRKLICDDIWLRKAYLKAQQHDVLIIDDVRFPNEAAWVREHGLLVHLKRVGYEPPASAHESDKPLDAGLFDRGVIAESIEELHRAALGLAHIIKNGDQNATAS